MTITTNTPITSATGTTTKTSSIGPYTVLRIRDFDDNYKSNLGFVFWIKSGNKKLGSGETIVITANEEIYSPGNTDPYEINYVKNPSGEDAGPMGDTTGLTYTDGTTLKYTLPKTLEPGSRIEINPKTPFPIKKTILTFTLEGNTDYQDYHFQVSFDPDIVDNSYSGNLLTEGSSGKPPYELSLIDWTLIQSTTVPPEQTISATGTTSAPGTTSATGTTSAPGATSAPWTISATGTTSAPWTISATGTTSAPKRRPPKGVCFVNC